MLNRFSFPHPKGRDLIGAALIEASVVLFVIGLGVVVYVLSQLPF